MPMADPRAFFWPEKRDLSFFRKIYPPEKIFFLADKSFFLADKFFFLAEKIFLLAEK
ncbi:MAG: hypothetical protein IJ828_08095 [Treponema sp.]|nr:hypothetical protein [Treponema sp.]